MSIDLSSIPPIIITDIDGTLSDHRHRLHHAVARDWDAYHATMHEDPVHKDVLGLLDLYSANGATIIACTARPAAYQARTTIWLLENGVPVDFLLMREPGDYRPSSVVKIEAMERWLAQTLDSAKVPFDGSATSIREIALQKVLFVLEDLDSVVQGWRDYGLNCWQVRKDPY